MKRRQWWFYGIGIMGAMAVLAAVLLKEQYYWPLSLLMIGFVMLPFFIRFEIRKVKTEELLLIAILAAIAAVSRVPFAALPSVQPTSFVIMMAALVFGAETGFLIGCLAAVVSNMFLGQGPWTPWQMFSWGMLGFTAGLLRDSWFMKRLWGKLTFGFLWGFLFGWIMNLWFLLGSLSTLTWYAFAAAYAASFTFDLAHALSNVFFIAVFSATWLKLFQRIQAKYGLLSPLT